MITTTHAGTTASIGAAIDEALLLLTIMSVWVDRQTDAEEVSVDELFAGFTLLLGSVEKTLISLRSRIQ